MNGKPGSGRRTNIVLKESCYQQFLAGRPLKEISKNNGVSYRQLTRWKKDWSLQQQQQSSAETSSIAAEIRKRIVDALKDSSLKPLRWKELTDSLSRLEKLESSGSGSTTEQQFCSVHSKALTCASCETDKLTDEALDTEIARLQDFINRPEREPPQSFRIETETEEVN